MDNSLCVENMSRNLRAFTVGVGVIAALSSAVMTLLYYDVPSGVALIMWGSLTAAGFVTAAMAASKKILLAVLLVFPAALLFGLENGLWQLAGKPADHIGAEGFVIVLLMSIPFGAFLCAVGGVLGWLVTRHSTHNKALQDDARSARA